MFYRIKSATLNNFEIWTEIYLFYNIPNLHLYAISAI